MADTADATLAAAAADAAGVAYAAALKAILVTSLALECAAPKDKKMALLRKMTALRRLNRLRAKFFATANDWLEIERQ